VAEIWITLVEKNGQSEVFVPKRVENGGYRHVRWLAKVFCNIIGVSLLVLDVQLKLLHIKMWTTSDGDHSTTSLMSV
jgi:hypothetical protein